MFVIGLSAYDYIGHMAIGNRVLTTWTEGVHKWRHAISRKY